MEPGVMNQQWFAFGQGREGRLGSTGAPSELKLSLKLFVLSITAV